MTQDEATRERHTRLERLVTPFARATPEHPAIEGSDETLTYAALDAMANRFARAFLANGLRSGDRVGIHLPRSGRGVAAMLGALRAGAVYVPLDPSSPPARMQLIATDCGLSHVVIAPHLLASWRAAGVGGAVAHFYLSADARPSSSAASASGDAPASRDALAASSSNDASDARVHPWGALAALSASPVEARAAEANADDPQALAYLLYTSGSTGVPKGVMLSHENALAFVHWAADAIALHAGDRVASVAPFHFDLSVFDLWSTLSRGATVVIVDETTVVSGPRMLERIRDRAISVWYSVPSALVLMLDHASLGERGAPTLRVVFFAGEVFPIKHLGRAMAALPQARFFNLFGPTETNVCTAYEVPGPPAPEAMAIPIGRAACGDTCTVLGPGGAPVAQGEVGELFVDGPTIMLGYWDGGRRARAARPYPTGDLVSERPDGALMYHGRRDHLVKIHGFRVELGEVEAALNDHGKIREAIAMAVAADRSGALQLVVVAVPSDPTVSVLELKQHCATRLPRYMIPASIRLVAQLPRTSSGKIDRVRTKTAVVENDTVLLAPVARADVPS